MSHETLRLSCGEVAAEVVPARGALVATLQVGGTDVLFLDRSTLDDPARNVRGGIPVLFPFAGRLVDDRFVPAGTVMKQHGFGRNKPWTVLELLVHNRGERPLPVAPGWHPYFRCPASRKADVRGSVPGLEGQHTPALRHMQFWSQPGRDFVCLEPFLGPNGTVNTERRLEVPPGQARDLWMRIEVDP